MKIGAVRSRRSHAAAALRVISVMRSIISMGGAGSWALPGRNSRLRSI
jgi:hypothetical protein